MCVRWIILQEKLTLRSLIWDSSSFTFCSTCPAVDSTFSAVFFASSACLLSVLFQRWATVAANGRAAAALDDADQVREAEAGRTMERSDNMVYICGWVVCDDKWERESILKQ